MVGLAMGRSEHARHGNSMEKGPGVGTNLESHTNWKKSVWQAGKEKRVT